MTKKITLTRHYKGENNSLFGHLIIDTLNHGTFKFSTVENTNAKIDEGTYLLAYSYSPRFRCETLQLIGVENRTGIRIHSGNRGNDLQGCIAIGLYNDFKQIPYQIFYSRHSTEILEGMLRDGGNKITIINDIKNETHIIRENSNQSTTKTYRTIN